MPSIHSPLGALPSRFRRERLLIVGCGDVGHRLLRELRGRIRILSLNRSASETDDLRRRGVTPLPGDLDDARSLRRLAGLATRIVYLAPPNADHSGDPRLLSMTRVLRQGTRPRSLVYASTSGVYGDCQGEWVSETRRVNPSTPRAARRLAAESEVRLLGRSLRGGEGMRTAILRVPGIYALDRPGGNPAERLQRLAPVLSAADDVYTNHIQADDLARVCMLALWKGRRRAVYNVNDDSELMMGEYFDLAAELLGLPAPPRRDRQALAQELTATRLSFMSESRRMDNRRMKLELGLRLRYPSVRQGLAPPLEN